MQPLYNEAKKYKSAEEFIKAQGDPVYHGTNADFTEFGISKSQNTLYGRGIYFAESPDITKQYGKRTIEAYIDRDSVLELDKPLTTTQKENLKKVLGADYWDWNKENNSDRLYGRLGLTHKNVEKILGKAGIKGVQHNQYTSTGINKNFVIFDKSAIKTKSQLEQIWKEANKLK